MLEKGKDPLLGKLCTITLIEDNLQTMMRIHLSTKKEELIEKILSSQKHRTGIEKLCY